MSWYPLVLAVLLSVPGGIAFKLSSESGRALVVLPRAERLFARFALSFVFLSWLSLIVGGMGQFRIATFASVAVASVIVTLALRPKTPRRPAKTHPRIRQPGEAASAMEARAGALLLTLIVALGAASYFPAFEQVIGARDPTTYVLWGMRLARDGGIVAHDPLVAGLDPEQVDTLFGPGHIADRASTLR